jgi:hypothetical protein
MARLIFASVQRMDTQHPVFHGCFDWHSAVHGHWALLRIARVTGRHEAEAQWVMAALDPQNIAAETEYLRRHPRFEMPYGRAWFLRLAIEYEMWIKADLRTEANALGDMADQVAASLLADCQARVLTPDSREYGNDSWALLQLHEFYKHRHDETSQELARLIERHFVNSQSHISFAVDHERPDFFSCFGNWTYLIAKSQDREAMDSFWQSHKPSDVELRPVQPPRGPAHRLGLNWSRAWALRAARRKLSDADEQRRLDAAYLKHVEAGLKTHELYKEDYGRYGHWVPQFAVYALTESTSSTHGPVCPE